MHLNTGTVYTKRINKQSSFYIVSYFWGKGKVNKNSIENLTYDKQVKRLIKDCKKHNVNYFFVYYPQLEKVDYMQALGLKPSFIKYCLKKLPNYKCIFIDTDLRILKYPRLFDADADCWFLNWNEYDYTCYNPLQLELPGAILGFGNTHNGKQLLDILISKLDKRYAEDKTFSGIITRNFLNVHLRCIWLPETYMYMFTKHEYTPGQGYTKIASYKEEFTDNFYKQSDIVMVHEDFETGALEDVYEQKVGRNRFPPQLDRQMGEKLRCYNPKFIKYIDWGLDKFQTRHLQVDAQFRESAKLLRIDYVPKVIHNVQSNLVESRTYKPQQTHFVIMIDSHSHIKNIDKFIDTCKKHKCNYAVYFVDSTVLTNQPILIRNILKQLQTSICFLGSEIVSKKNVLTNKIWYNTTIDFMMYNKNAIFKDGKCYDPRVLHTVNTSPLFYAYNKHTLQFLQIWASHNTKSIISKGLQHKSLEYSFNISNAINHLRCYWTPSSFGILTNSKHTHKKANELRKALQQCGIKKPRNSLSEPYASHWYGSRGKYEQNKFSKQFLK
jgi:hypothetical protein